MSRITRSVQRSPIKSSEPAIGHGERRDWVIGKTRFAGYLHFTSNIRYIDLQFAT
jgi:hypothetical protein